MFIPNNDTKIVCKLEKDDGNVIKITGVTGSTHDYTQVKLTILAGNVSIRDIFHLSTPYHYEEGGKLFMHHKHENNALKHTSFSFSAQDVIRNLFFANGALSNEASNDAHLNFRVENIIPYNNKPIDFNKYLKGNDFALRLKEGSKLPGFKNTAYLDVYDYNISGRTMDESLGTLLPSIAWPYFDIKESKIKILQHTDNNTIDHADVPSNYFTIELKDGYQHGYFSDEKGNSVSGQSTHYTGASGSIYNNFALNCTALDLIQLAQIEELAQKTLELEECNSAALSTAQVKGKAISTVVNRVKRQVEEDEAFKGDIKDLLKGDKDFKDSVRGERGIQGFEGIPGATAEQVAKFLLTQKGNDLGKAVIDADSSSQHPLSSKITHWLKDQLKDDQDFQENVADELLDRTNGNSIVSEVAKRINKRSVEDRAVKKVTDKVDVQDVVDKVDPDLIMRYQVDKLIEAIDISTAEQIIRDNSESKQTRFVDQLIKIVGKGKAEAIVREKADQTLLIDKLLEANPHISLSPQNINDLIARIGTLATQQKEKIIGILTDPSNTELIIKAFADKYPEIDIESIIKNLQKPRAARDFNVRNSFKQGEEAAQQAEIAQKSAENARDEAKGFANQAQSSAKEATSAKNASINSLHEIAQRYSNLSRDKSNLLRKAHKVKSSTVEENVSEETTQILTMHDIRRLLEKNVSASANRVKRNAKNMVDSSEERTVKEIKQINSQVTQMESEVSEVRDMFTQVDERQQEMQERMQEIEQDVHQVGSDFLNAQRMNRKVAQRVEDSEHEAKKAAEESVDARDESQNSAKKSESSASEAQKSAERAVDARDKSQNFAEKSQNSASEAQVSVERAAQAIEKIEEEMKDIEQRIPHTTPYSSTYKEKKDQIKIIQSDDNSTEIEVEGKGVIGKFSKAGYYFRSGQLHIHNPETGVDIVVPSECNLLKVVENSEMPKHYMLVLTNQLGNELFEYKKYDSTFSSLANEFKSLDLQQIKTLNKINFQNGSYFILKPGAVSSQGYAVNVHEIESNEKIGTLVDEFCYYQNGKFNYINYHTGSEIHHPSSHEHYLSLSQSENYQAESSIVCEESSEKVAYDVNPIITSEFGLLEYLADHSAI